jgi:TolB-like protein
VLPFKYTGGNAELKGLADGLTDDIVTGLSRFSYLRVIARSSTVKYSGESGDVRAIGKELAARFVMEGNLRQAGTKLRLAIQLVDATDGAHIWAENFERTFDPDSVFALQDELVPRIVSTVADAHGILPHTTPASATTGSGAARTNEGFWVAVLPFKSTGTSPELKTLADGLSEEIVTGLSRFSYLRVIARGSTAKYSSESGDVRAIGKELGARYVMEGSLRQAGTKLRLAVQLVDATTGAHLWAETYERPFNPQAVFELQDDLVPRIVSTVADQYGILPRSMSEVLRSKKEEDLTPPEAVLRTFTYFTRQDSRSEQDATAGTQKEPGALGYDWYLSGDRKRCRIVETLRGPECYADTPEQPGGKGACSETPRDREPQPLRSLWRSWSQSC